MKKMNSKKIILNLFNIYYPKIKNKYKCFNKYISLYLFYINYV